MSALDLRAELGLHPEPEFDMTLPPGWTRREADDQARDTMLLELRQRLMKEHKPAAYAELKPLLTEAFDGMRRDGAFAFFSASDPSPGTLWVPASIVASTRRAEPGHTLDSLVRTLIRDDGATPLLGNKGIVRFERERMVRLANETMVNQSVIYLIPIPGAKRQRALQLVAGFGRPVDTPSDDPHVLALKQLFDSCVSTLRWRAPDKV